MICLLPVTYLQPVELINPVWYSLLETSPACCCSLNASRPAAAG